MKIQLIFIYILVGLSSLSYSQNDYLKKQFITNGDTLKYRILFPKDFDNNKTYPLVLFLHGAGERGSNNEAQLVHGSKLFLNETFRDSFPAIILFPQCPKDDYWAQVDVNRNVRPLEFDYHLEKGPTKSLRLVMALINEYTLQPFVERKQIYVGGLSMGGMGTFEILNRLPNTFAAAFAICGGGDPEGTKAYAKKTKIWIFHGSVDDVVPPQLSLDMAKGIFDNGGNPNITFYENDNHNSWDSAFAEPNLLPWLFSKTK